MGEFDLIWISLLAEKPGTVVDRDERISQLGGTVMHLDAGVMRRNGMTRDKDREISISGLHYSTIKAERDKLWEQEMRTATFFASLSGHPGHDPHVWIPFVRSVQEVQWVEYSAITAQGNPWTVLPAWDSDDRDDSELSTHSPLIGLVETLGRAYGLSADYECTGRPQHTLHLSTKQLGASVDSRAPIKPFIVVLDKFIEALEATVAGIPRNQAWLERKDEIDDFVLKGSRNGVAAAYAGSDTRVVYLILGRYEGEILIKYLKSASFASFSRAEVSGLQEKLSDDTRVGSVTIMLYKQFLNQFHPRAQQPATIVLLDLEACPTVKGEIVVVYLLDWADTLRKQDEAGTGNVPKTVKTLTRWTRSTMREIVVPERNPEVHIKKVRGDFEEHVANLISESHNGSEPLQDRVLIFQDRADWLDLGNDSVASIALELDSPPGAVAESRAFIVQPQTSSSNACKGSKYVVSAAWIDTNYFNLCTSQILVIQRRPTQLEIAQVRS
ncbi:hypothetical protein AAE478_007635 [Parahypoxylon ruwenzoriense]